MKPRAKRPVAERFWEKVDKSGGPDACWIFTHARRADGYCRFGWNDKTIQAHRAAYLLERGAIPPGLIIRHTCDKPPCVNPAHLVIGTHADNVRDKCERGRHIYGEKHPWASLTSESVERIRTIYSAGGISQKALGAQFGVSASTISSVVLGRDWRSVGGPIISPRKKNPATTVQKIAEIKAARESEGLSYRELGRRFGIRPQTAWNIVNGVTRGTVTKPMGEFEKIHRVKLSAT